MVLLCCALLPLLLLRALVLHLMLLHAPDWRDRPRGTGNVAVSGWHRRLVFSTEKLHNGDQLSSRASRQHSCSTAALLNRHTARARPPFHLQVAAAGQHGCPALASAGAPDGATYTCRTTLTVSILPRMRQRCMLPASQHPASARPSTAAARTTRAGRAAAARSPLVNQPPRQLPLLQPRSSRPAASTRASPPSAAPLAAPSAALAT